MTTPVVPTAASGPSEGKHPESGLKRVLANLAHLLGGKAAAGLMSLIYLAIVARTLGVERYGVLVLVNGYALAVGSLVAFSGFHGVVRYGTLALEAGDRARLARIIRFMAVVEFAFGLLALLVAALAVPLVGPRLGWSPDAMRLAIPYSLAVFSTVRATPQGLLQIGGRFDLVGIQQIASPVVRLVGTLLVWAAGWGLDGFIIVWLLSSLAEGAAMWLLAWPTWRKIAGGERLIGPWRGLTRDIQGFGRFILTTNFDITLRELAPNLAPLTIGWMLGPAAAGLFTLAQKTTALLQQPAILIGQASYAVLAEQVARRRLDLLRATVWRSALLVLAIGLLFVLALAVVGDPLMRLLGGHSFAGGTVIITLLAGGRAAALVAAPLTAGLTALGKPQRSLAVTLFTNLLLYPLLPLLILWLGLDGAGWHALGQSLAATAMLMLFFLRDSREP
jgi:O-antigen/teichoic acid export membrane protein